MIRPHKLLATCQAEMQPLKAYLLSIMVVVAALAFLLNTEPYFVVAPASVFHCGVLIASLIGGFGPGLLAVTLAILAFDYCYVNPVHSFVVAQDSILRISIFGSTALFVALAGGAQKINIKKLRLAKDELKKTLFDLERTHSALQKENQERKAIQEELNRKEAFLIEAQKISKTGSWRWDLSKNIHVWSDELFRILGYDHLHDIPSVELVFARMYEEDREEIARIVSASSGKGLRFECKYRIIHPAGYMRHLHAIGTPIINGEGEVKDYIGVVVDVTEQVETENQLRKSEQQYRMLAENLPDGLVRYDLNLKRTYVNPAYERSFELPQDVIFGKPMEQNWHSDIDVQKYKDMIRQVMESGKPAELVGQWRCPGGKKIHFAIKIVAEHNIQGEVIGALAIGRDITALKMAEKELSESRDVIRELAYQNDIVREEERKHLARELHDDLAQYLLALRMKISLLDIEYGAAMPQIGGKTKSMIEIVDSTIKSARNVMSTLRPAALDMGIEAALEWLAEDFVTRTGTKCMLRIETKNIVLAYNEQITVFRIVQESLRNIEKHAQARHVEINLSGNESTFKVSVIDDGIGFIPTDRKPHSFGLIGIKERLLMLNGRLDMVTGHGKGTKVHITFPLANLPANDAENFIS